MELSLKLERYLTAHVNRRRLPSLSAQIPQTAVSLGWEKLLRKAGDASALWKKSKQGVDLVCIFWETISEDRGLKSEYK